MESYRRSLEIRWADLDPNFHVLHSKYYDMGAYVRMCFLTEHGVTPKAIHEFKVGPILLREECVFRREVHFGDAVSIDLALLKARHDMSRWSIRHQIYKGEDTLAAVITVDGTWIDLQRRKIAAPPESFRDSFEEMPKAEGFVWLDK
jgi:acyl-CoA thioester hydrolase